MSEPQISGQVGSAPVQTPLSPTVIGSPRCPCGNPLGPRALSPRRPQRYCSSRCRGRAWRQEKAETRTERDREVESLLGLAELALAQARRRLSEPT